MQSPSIYSLLQTAFCIALIGILVFGVPVVASAIAGIEGTFEYAFDAPWRLEPSQAANGSTEYGAIPIQLSIHDVNYTGFDNPGQTLGEVCEITVEYEVGGQGIVLHQDVGDLDEIEVSRPWVGPPGICVGGVCGDDEPLHLVCRKWDGQDCEALNYGTLAGFAEWHGLLWFAPPMKSTTTLMLPGYQPGDTVSLDISLYASPGYFEGPDGRAIACEDTTDRIRLRNNVRIELARESLPRFGPGWLYGDLHYHSQGTDNDGESAYNYRGVTRAMGAMGLDFAFATEHASNSRQILDADFFAGKIIGDERIQIRAFASGLRDMSDPRFRFLTRVLTESTGVNREAAIRGYDGREPQTMRSTGVVPRIFLGGEVDVIPETDPLDLWDSYPYGNGGATQMGLSSLWDDVDLHGVKNVVDMCGGWFDKSQGKCSLNLIRETETNGVPVADGVLLKDNALVNILTYYGRLHMVYLPKDDSPDLFVASNTSRMGGGTRRLVEDHMALMTGPLDNPDLEYLGPEPTETWELQSGMLPEIEDKGGYVFLAHPMSGRGEGGRGPDAPPWSDHLLEKAWMSKSVLGLQLWNSDGRLTEDIEPWWWDCEDGCSLQPGDDLGYERPDQQDTDWLGITIWGLREAPTDHPRAGFSNLRDQAPDDGFQLRSTGMTDGLWDKYSLGIEESLHHGAYTWDRMNHWGLNVRKTQDIDWLPQGEPRRTLMAGGSDAHGDLGARRDGYLVGIDKITDTAIGKPRNLVAAGEPDTYAANGQGAIYLQSSVVKSLAAGRFSVTDGPALRAFIDQDGDCVFEPGDVQMGGVARLFEQSMDSLPVTLCVEWKSTSEFGEVEFIDLYVGARSSLRDLTSTNPHIEGPVYAVRNHGPRYFELTASDPSLREGHYIPGPPTEPPLRIEPATATATGDVKCTPAGGDSDLDGYSGKCAIELNLREFVAGCEYSGGWEPNQFTELARSMLGQPGGCTQTVPANRFFIRTVAKTRPDVDCILGDPDFLYAEQTGQCIRRYAFTNPIWAIEGEPEYVHLEAESGNFQQPMQIGNDATASSGAYVEGGSGGLASYWFNVGQTGEYVVHMRKSAVDGADGTFDVFVTEPSSSTQPVLEPIGGSSPLRWDASSQPDGAAWSWNTLRDRFGGAARYSLVAGRNYQVSFRQIESGSRLDQLLITNDSAFDPPDRARGDFDPAPVSPLSGGSLRLDWCYGDGTDCGAPAAHSYCELMHGEGWAAESFGLAANIGATQVLGTGEICDSSGCDGFSFIQCIDTRRTTTEPMFRGYRLDLCRFWGSSCGQPAADAWCRYTNGSMWYADAWSEAPDVGPTRVIANSLICDSPDCDGFAEITCAYIPSLVAVADDADFDGVTDLADNCPSTPNPFQLDRDDDSLGDECDPYPLAAPECGDGLDNDGDGMTDAADPGCSSILDSFETSSALPCDDGLDNDGDGAIDFLMDPECVSPVHYSETTQCTDGIDNDADGLKDDLDPDCADRRDDSEWSFDDGDVVVADWNAGLYLVDPASGEQWALHSGAPLVHPMGVAITPGGDVLISDNGADSVFRLSQLDGSITVVTSHGHLSSPRYMAIDPAGNALVCNQNGWVVRVDLGSGEQTILNSSTGIDWCEGISSNSVGHIVVADRAGDRIVEVDAATGTMTPMQPGGPFGLPIGIAFEDDDHVIVSDDGTNELYRVTLSTGARSTISQSQAFSRMRGVTTGGYGTIYVVDVDGGLIRVDPSQPVTTNQQLISGGDMGTPMGVATYVPEPRATTQLLAGLMMLLGLRVSRLRTQ